MEYLLLFLPVVICVSAALKKKSFYSAVLLSCMGCLVGVLLWCLLIYAVTGMDVVSYMNSSIAEVLKADQSATIATYKQLEGTMNLLNGTISPEAILQGNIGVAAQSVDFETAYNALYTSGVQGIAMGLPVLITCWCTLGGLVVFLIPWGISKKRGAQITRVPPFSEFYLPQFMGWGSMALLVIMLITLFGDFKGGSYIVNISYTFLMCIYGVQTMALLEFFLKRRIKSAAGRVLLIIVIVFVIMLLWGMLLMLIGMAEQAFSIRKRSADSE